MSDGTMTIACWEPVQAHRVMTAQIWPALKSMLMAGNPMVLEVRRQKRSLKENAMLHAMLGYISKNMEWAGKKRDIETWKRLLVAAWCRATNEAVELLPAVDGHGVDIVYRKTSKLSKAECAELIEFIFAWGSANDIQFPDPKAIEYTDPETGEIFYDH